MLQLSVPENTFGYMINPSGVAVIITKTWLNRIKESMVLAPENIEPKKETENI